MADQSRDNERPRSTKRTKRRFRWIITIVTILFLCLFFWFAWQYLSVDKKLAAIDSARAIDEDENAAIIYNQLLKDYNESHFKPSFLTPAIHDITYFSHWPSKDYPELSKWIEEKQDIIEKLLCTSKFQKYRFPINDFLKDPDLYIQRLATMRQWMYFLIRAANNDIAEGRIDQALEKYFCVFRMGRHNRQQPVAIDFLVGIAMESIALQRLRLCILHNDLTEEHLQIIEKVLPQPDDEWTRQWDNMLEVEKLLSRKLPLIIDSSGLLDYFKKWWQNSGNFENTINKVHEIYLRLLAERHGSQILIALRCYKDKTGRWPETLDELSPFVDKGILIDPQNKSTFVYKLTDEGFFLYSKGPNNIDEKGQERGGADDRSIWPLDIPQIKDQNAEAD